MSTKIRKHPQGRKPLPDDERRSERVAIFLSAAEMRRILRAACGKPLSTWVRGVVLKASP